MNNQDIQRANELYRTAHVETDKACTEQEIAGIEVHMTQLEKAISGMEFLTSHYDKLVKENEAKRDELKAQYDAEAKKWRCERDETFNRRKVLERDFERCKRHYWALRRERDRINP